MALYLKKKSNLRLFKDPREPWFYQRFWWWPKNVPW